MDHRADRMKSLIIRTFFDCMEKEDFSQITIGKISEQALINRSTFTAISLINMSCGMKWSTILFRICRSIWKFEFSALWMSVMPNIPARFQDCLAHLCTQKRELEILWKQQLLGRNVFDEMINAGARKVEAEILNHPTISAERKQLADWYAKLLVNNYLVTVRWWFSHSDTVSASQITTMMKRHMLYGTIPTLKESH